MRGKPLKKILTLAAIVALTTVPCQPQRDVGGRTEQQKLLELRRRHLSVRQAKAQFEGRKRLVEAGLAARSELEAAETAYLQAQTEYQQTFLSLFSEVPRITVLQAVKRITREGRRNVSLTLRNDSIVNLDYEQLGVVEGDTPLPDQLRLREVGNLYVSLKDADGVIVSRPYEKFVARLPAGVESTLDFDLLKDVDTVIVTLNYGGQADEREVYLEKDASANIVTIQSSRFSQEADLGGTASYDLKLERFTSNADIFKLETLNLPESIERAFVVGQDTETRLNQIKFIEGETTKELSLRLNLPDLAEQSGLRLDEPIRFWVAAFPGEAARETRDGIGESEIAANAAGKVELELIPRGVARLEVRIPNLFQSVLVGQEVRFQGTVRNIGTRSVRNVRVSSDVPFQWTFESQPSVIDLLEANEERPFTVLLVPPESIAVGDYSVKLLTEASVNSKAVSSEDKIARIKVTAPVSVLQSAVTAGLLGLLLLAIAGFGVRMMKR